MSSIRALSFLLAVTAPLFACAASTSDGDVSSDTSQALSCDLSGTWAIKIETPVKWNASVALTGGTGVVANWLLSTRTQNGLDITDSATICAAETPDYTAGALFGSEKYGIQFGPSAFASLPKVPLTATLSSTDVGATFSAPPLAALIGATLPNPATDAWPNVAAVAGVDVDGDGHPGVTAGAKSDSGFSLLPVNAQRSARADKAYTAFRQVVDASTGTMTSCTRVDGHGAIAVIKNKPAIDSHVIGCHRVDGPECTAAEFKLLDSAAPIYTPTGDAIITMVKVSGTPTCADVRALDFASAQ